MEEIKATDLAKLMAVVQAAIGLYNALDVLEPGLPLKSTHEEFDRLGNALKALGLKEVEA